MIVRHHTFRLGEGVDDDDFLAADRRVQAEVAPFAPGFIRRTTARGTDGAWLIETMWQDRSSSDGDADARHDATLRLRACLDPTSESVAVYETLD